MRTINRQNAITVSMAALIAASGTVAANAQSNQELQHQVEALTDRVNELESQDTRLSFGAGSGTEITLYGYIKADFIQDLDTDLGTTIFGLTEAAPGNLTGSNFQAHALQSRLGVRTKTHTALGELGVQIEGDFFGDGGGGFRLRHANATLGGWLIGQYWTNFMPLNAYPVTVDFQGPAGLPFARQTQIRYTHQFGGGLSGAVSLEDSTSNSDEPVVTAALAYQGEQFFARGALLAGTVEGPNNNVDAWGLNLSGTLDLWEGGGLNATYTYGEGIGSIMVFGGADTFANGGSDTAVEVEGATLGVTHRFNDKWSVAAAYGYRENDIGIATATERLDTVHLTAFWNPVEQMTVGLEYIIGEREQFNGVTTDADRVQLGVQVSF